MAEGIALSFSALWLGILTSLSPCPLATNIAAISFIGQSVQSPRKVLWSGALYTVGRAMTYVALGSLLVLSLLSAPYLSYVLEHYMNKILGLILILVGMFLLDLVTFDFGGRRLGSRVVDRATNMGICGAALLGIGFALSFCPVSAALFFGGLIPLAVQNQSAIALPSLYGIGTGIPVVAFAVLASLSAHSVGKAFAGLHRLERWARRLTGVVFVGVGIYLTLVYVFGVPL